MTLRKQLEQAQQERDRVPLGCWAEFCKRQQIVRDLFDEIARR